MGRPSKGKTNSLTIRIEPRARYGLELLARKQRRTLSSVIEWAILGGISNDGIDLQSLWDVDEAERLKKLVERHPELINYDEQVFLRATLEQLKKPTGT